MNKSECFVCKGSSKIQSFIIYFCQTCEFNTCYCIPCNQSIVVLLENKYFKCSNCEVLIPISYKQYITNEENTNLKEFINNETQYTVSSTQHEMYTNPLENSPIDYRLNKIFQSNNDKSRISKLKLLEADDSRDLKAQQTAERTIIKQNKGYSNYEDSAYYYLSSNLGYVESTPIKSNIIPSYDIEFSPLIPRKVDFDQKLYDSKLNSHEFKLHTILDSKPGSKCNILHNIK